MDLTFFNKFKNQLQKNVFLDILKFACNIILTEIYMLIF